MLIDRFWPRVARCVSPLRYLSVLVFALAPFQVLANDHVMSPGDTLKIRAGTWSFTEQIYQEWAGISGDYVVGPAGMISVALVGDVQAANKTTRQLSEEISRLLQTRIGLPESPSIAVEIASYRPIFVSGAVQSPGAHPYSVGLTVGQALALAGGPPRALAPGQANSGQEIELRGRLEEISVGIRQLTAQETRLTLEIASYEGEEGSSDESATPLPELEVDLQEANRTAVASQQEALRELQGLLSAQIVRLDEEMRIVTSQIDATAEELARVADLQERGLVVANRVSSLEGNLGNMEARRLQLEVARLTAEQQRNTALREEAGILDQARLRRLTELKATREALADLRIRHATVQALYRERLALGTDAPGDFVLPPPVYRITRRGESGVEVFQAEQSDLIKPGDLLEVIQPVAEASPIAANQ